MNVPGMFSSSDQEIGYWEGCWAPYDSSTYQSVLQSIDSDDILLDIGAGDLRLARRAATLARKVYAIELQQDLIDKAILKEPLPENLEVIQGDARLLSFPEGLTCGILLMRHCTCYALYAAKLKASGADRLLTNARWGLGVEIVRLTAPRTPFKRLAIGWYACACGQVGFKPGPVEWLTVERESTVYEVLDCPACRLDANAERDQ